MRDAVSRSDDRRQTEVAPASSCAPLARTTVGAALTPGSLVELEAGVRQLVDAGSGRWRQHLLRNDARRLEVAEPGRKDVRPDSGQALGKVGVALGALGELADDEEGPAVAHDVEGVGNGAVLVVVLRHRLDHSGSA